MATHSGSIQDVTNGVGADIDLTAKPFARGCWACITTGTCSLLHDERHWPCQTCFEDDLDCEPIIPPVRKRACEMCKRRRMSCSYTYTRQHGGSCEQCERVGQRCIAGPVKEFIRPRISYDRDWEADPFPKRRGGKQKELEDCLECVGGGRRCSYPAGCPGSPCEGCTTRGLPCTISANATTESASPAGSAAPDHMESKTLQDNVTELVDSRPKGTVHKIYTSFSHPITFNCDLESGQDSSCDYCTEIDLPAIGFGIMHPEVFDRHDGSGFIEMKGGHTQVHEIGKTKICYACTSGRLAIVTCYQHRLGKLPPQDTDQAPVCNICVSQAKATFGCMPTDRGESCGLKLCRPCAVTLNNDYRGVLGEMLGSLADRPEDPANRALRADHEFLKEDGHIARYLKYLDT